MPLSPVPGAKRKFPETVLYPDDEKVQTPTGSPATKKMRLTRKQKQIVIDNLQLEGTRKFLCLFHTIGNNAANIYFLSITVTERARRMRIQYALQAGDLRGRIERRINRVPVSLRKKKMGDLLETHNAAALRGAAAAAKKPISPVKSRNMTIDRAKGKSSNAGSPVWKTKQSR